MLHSANTVPFFISSGTPPHSAEQDGRDREKMRRLLENIAGTRDTYGTIRRARSTETPNRYITANSMLSILAPAISNHQEMTI